MISFRTNEETMRLNISLKSVKVAALVRPVDNYLAALFIAALVADVYNLAHVIFSFLHAAVARRLAGRVDLPGFR
jgi:hypothetical protein